MSVEVNADHLCGVPHGTVHVRLATDLPGDPLHQAASVGFYLAPSGGTKELACTVAWEREPLPGLNYTSDAVHSPHDYTRTADPANVADAVSRTLLQARIQRALDAQINDPQAVAILTAREVRGRTWTDTLRVEAQVRHDGVKFLFTDDRRRGRNRLTLDVDDTGRVVDGWMDTDYGTVNVTGTSLHRVCARLEQELRWATEIRSAEDPTKEHLEARLSAALTVD